MTNPNGYGHGTGLSFSCGICVLTRSISNAVATGKLTARVFGDVILSATVVDVRFTNRILRGDHGDFSGPSRFQPEDVANKDSQFIT